MSLEILSDVKTPIEVLQILKSVSGHCYLPESVADNEKWGRYTFLGYDPSLEITCVNGTMKVGNLTFETRNPGKYIRQVIAEHKSPRLPSLPPFTSGVTMDKILGMVRTLRKDITVPLVFMTYANVGFSYGSEKFLSTCNLIYQKKQIQGFDCKKSKP